METTSKRAAARQPESKRAPAQKKAEGTLGTRDRIIHATSRLFQQQGYEGTGIKQIAREAGATLGSVYHFFPGGKQELATAAIRHGDQEFADVLRDGLGEGQDPGQALIDCAANLARWLRESDWLDGCPLTATALEAVGRTPDIQQAVAHAFDNWRNIVADRLLTAGIPEQDARDLAHTVIATLEGAELSAQVSRSEQPLLIAGRHLARLINSFERTATAD